MRETGVAEHRLVLHYEHGIAPFSGDRCVEDLDQL